MTTILKLGGELLEDAEAMRTAAAAIALMAAEGPLAIVHGGGRAIDADLRARGKAPRFVDGLRVTDDDTLETVVAVLAGRINTAFVAALVAAGVKAVGLTGADAAIGISTLAPPLKTTTGTLADLGLVGIPADDAPAQLLSDLLALGYVPVVASVGISADGNLLNVNADTLAGIMAFRHPDMDAIQRVLHANKVHVMSQAGRMRVAIHGYNTAADIERFLTVLTGALRHVATA